MTQILTPEGILSYPHLVKPQEETNPGGKFKGYSCSVMFVDGTDLTKLWDNVNEVCKKKWGETPQDLEWPPIETIDHEGEQVVRVKFKRKTEHKPLIFVGRDKLPINPADLYAGCKVRVACGAYAWGAGEDRGYSLGFSMVQKTGDGDPIGSNPIDLLDDLEGEEDIFA